MKPTDLFTYGLIPEFTGRLPIIARFHDLDRADDGPHHDRAAQLDLSTSSARSSARKASSSWSSSKVFEQIAELAIEYKTGARSLRGIFEELMTPILYDVTDHEDIEKVVVASLFSEPTYVRKAAA